MVWLFRDCVILHGHHTQTSSDPSSLGAYKYQLSKINLNSFWNCCVYLYVDLLDWPKCDTMTLAFNLLYWRKPACAEYHESSLQTVHKDYCGDGPRFIHGVFSDVQPVLIKMAPSWHIHIYHTPGKRGGVGGGCGHMSTHTVRSHQTWSQRPKWGVGLANGGWKSHLKTATCVQISMKSLPIEKWV